MSVFSLLISIKRDRAEALAAIKAVWKLDELILSSFGSGDFYASERKRHDLFFYNRSDFLSANGFLPEFRDFRQVNSLEYG